MTHVQPSIQSFYKREVRVESQVPVQEPIEAGDGFTEEELADVLDPLNRKWNPEQEYDQVNISQLVAGPQAVTFCGRIVNLNTVYGRNPKQPKASGWHYLLIKDDSAAISVKLFFALAPYPLKLTQLLTLWTLFISDTSKSDDIRTSHVSMCANMFPGRVTSDHVMVHTSSATSTICRSPLSYIKARPLLGLVTLESYINSAHDGVLGVKILVCVKSIGQRKRINKKAGGECELADILLFDHTAEIRMTLWNEIIESTREWVAGSSILLITNPGYKVGYNGKPNLGVQRGTMVEVDPDFADAEWLRKRAVSMMKREALVVKFPESVWDVEAAGYGVVRMLFTIAELDRWVRSDGYQTFTGFINVIIMDLSLASLHRRNMLMCGECCALPHFSSFSHTTCRNCSLPLSLSLNPRMIGTIIDETGSIAGHKLIWAPQAWEQLLGRTAEELCAMSEEEIRWLECRMGGLRCHFLVGWLGEGEGGEEKTGGRLAVLGMRM